MNGKSAVDISLDLTEAQTQTFVEVPLTVKNNTPDVLVLDTFLIRDDAPGDVVILAEPGWKTWIYGTLDNPLAQRETTLYTTWLRPGEDKTSKIWVKFLFEGEKRVTGRLTYQRVEPQDFDKRVVPPRLELKNLEPGTLIEIPDEPLSPPDAMEALRPGPPVAFPYWPGGGIYEKAFIKKRVSVSAHVPGPTGCSVTGPEWILPSAEPRIIEGCTYSVALKTWLVKEPGACYAVPREHLEVMRLPPNIDLGIFDYADKLADRGLDEIENGCLAGQMIGGSVPEFDLLELGVAHRATYGGRLFSVKIEDLLDTLVRIGASKDFAMVDYIGVQVWPWHVRQALTPDRDWSDLHLWERDRMERYIDPSTGIWATRETSATSVDQVERDINQLQKDITELLRPARAKIEAGFPPEEVWAETEDKIIALQEKLSRRHDLRRRDWGAPYLGQFEEQLFKAADILGVHR